MKYCLSAHQTKEYLKKADELLIDYSHMSYILDLIEINPNASYVLYIDSNNDIDWNKVEEFYILTKKQFKVMLAKLNYDECIRRKIPFFFSHAIDNPYELNAVIELGVAAVRITGQLTHMLNYIETLPVEVRVCVNNSGAPFFYKPIIGGWFRPEDVNDLTAIDVCEFNAATNREEQALYRIYAEDKAWPGELYMLVKEIDNKEITNRMIPSSFQERRSNCGMRCLTGGHCNFCYTLTYLANPKLLEFVKDTQNVQNTITDVGSDSV